MTNDNRPKVTNISMNSIDISLTHWLIMQTTYHVVSDSSVSGLHKKLAAKARPDCLVSLPALLTCLPALLTCLSALLTACMLCWPACLPCQYADLPACPVSMPALFVPTTRTLSEFFETNMPWENDFRLIVLAQLQGKESVERMLYFSIILAERHSAFLYSQN